MDDGGLRWWHEAGAEEEFTENEMKVYAAINSIQRELCKTGITKDRKNQQQGYSFRGIDDVFNALSPLLAEHGLCILPRIVARQCDERTNAKGTALFYVTVEAEFDFVCAEDSSRHTIRTFGEAMDSGDKATNKAMSAAYKYAAMQAFAIPTEGDNDADTTTHQVQARKPFDLDAAIKWIKLAIDIGEAKRRASKASELAQTDEQKNAILVAYREFKEANVALIDKE